MEILTAVVAVVATTIALWQLLGGQKAVRVQRVIDLHRDLTTGEVGEARDRFTSLMWKHGERQAGRNVCHTPHWEEILASVRGDEDSRGSLGFYAPDDNIAASPDAEPMRDLYSVLWCFERVEAGRRGRALNGSMLSALIASHAVWWDELTRHLDATNHTTHVESLRHLAKAVETDNLRAWARRDFNDARQ